MAWRPHGHYEVNSVTPRGRGVCDLCGIAFTLEKMHKLMEWRGTRLMWTGLVVCDWDYDRPQEQLRAKLLPPDPTPLLGARPEDFFSEQGPPPNPPLDPANAPSYGIVSYATTPQLPNPYPGGINPFIGPPVPRPSLTSDFTGGILTDDNGNPLLAE